MACGPKYQKEVAVQQYREQITYLETKKKKTALGNYKGGESQDETPYDVAVK